MYFYCFLCNFPSGSIEGTVFFRVFCVVCFGGARRPDRNSDLLPRFAMVGVVLLAILADRKQPKTKNTRL